MALNTSEFEGLLYEIEEFSKKYTAFLNNFLTEMGMRAMAQTKARTPVDTGNLRNRWELSDVTRYKDSLIIFLINPTVYASFIEEGHMQYERWVPGVWEGDRFIYTPNSKEGMKLKNKWIPGFFMARIAISKIESEIPARYEKALKVFLGALGR